MNILITGVAGTGKSSICKRLQQLGYKAHDVDTASGLCSWRNKKTGEKAEYHSGAGSEWVAKHDWICDTEKLRRLLSNNETVTFVCGIASNHKEIALLFDQVILLTLSNDKLIERLTNREGKNPYGKEKSEQQELLGWKRGWEDDVLQSEAIKIDTNKPLQITVEEILSVTGS